MAYGTITIRLGEAELASVGCDLPEGLEATVERDGQALVLTLAVAKPKRKAKKKAAT